MKKLLIAITLILLVACASGERKSRLEGVSDPAWTSFVNLWLDRDNQASQVMANAKPIAYNDLARRTEDHVGDTVVISGTVTQVLEGTKGDGDTIHSDIHMSVDEDQHQVFVFYQSKSRLLEGDEIEVYGLVLGRTIFVSTENEEISMPAIGAIVTKILP